MSRHKAPWVAARRDKRLNERARKDRAHNRLMFLLVGAAVIAAGAFAALLLALHARHPASNDHDHASTNNPTFEPSLHE